MSSYYEKSRRLHAELGGKIDYASKRPVRSPEDLALLYTPGVLDPCARISMEPDQAYELSGKGNLVAIVTDGSAVLELGNVGPQAALPVMEGTALLCKELGGVDAVPICLDTHDPDAIIQVVSAIAPTFGAINLEHIAPPHCFGIERTLKLTLDIPVFHSDQHGTAIVTLAGLMNALAAVSKRHTAVRVVINGAGSAGLAIARMLHGWGVEDVLVCDRRGVLIPGDPALDAEKQAVAEITNTAGEFGSVHDALQDADVLIDVSAGDVLTTEDVHSMAHDPIVFALAGPAPEIDAKAARDAGAKIVATGLPDYRNQISNVLAFPGLFRGVLDVRASAITGGMALAAAGAIAARVYDDELERGIVVPSALDRRVARAVAKAVAKEAVREQVARHALGDADIQARIDRRLPPRD